MLMSWVAMKELNKMEKRILLFGITFVTVCLIGAYLIILIPQTKMVDNKIGAVSYTHLTLPTKA